MYFALGVKSEILPNKPSSISKQISVTKIQIVKLRKIKGSYVEDITNAPVLSEKKASLIKYCLIYISERYHSIDTKMKGNPLSLEEMILMTIYS